MKLLDFIIFDSKLISIPSSKTFISTINAYSYTLTLRDAQFAQALQNSDLLIPDGVGVTLAIRLLTGKKIKKIAGADLFFYEMERLEKTAGKAFFLGSSKATLDKIKERASREYPNVEVTNYSPPYKSVFSNEENKDMIREINTVKPDVLFVGMTAPKQEKWAFHHFEQLNVGHVCCIGAVFDFYAGTVRRAPKWMIKMGLEWFYRFIKEPKRLWYRYLIGNTKFIYYVCREKFNNK